MLDSVDFYSFKIIFFLIDIEIIVSLIPWLLIKKRPDLKADFKKFLYSDVCLGIVFILSFIASLILKEPLIFTVFVCLSLAVSFLLMIIMIFRFFKGK